jgi:hypothetical protein
MTPPYSWTGLFVPGCARTGCCCSVILVGDGCLLVDGVCLLVDGVCLLCRCGLRPLKLSMNELARLNIMVVNVFHFHFSKWGSLFTFVAAIFA